MKVYVIEKGYYSDRHIIGVVESEEKAKEVIKAVRDNHDADSVKYTEYDTDQFNDKRFRYIVYNEYNVEWLAEYDAYVYDDVDETQKIYDGCYVVYADSAEQAIKIAQDMYYEEMAMKEGLV